MNRSFSRVASLCSRHRDPDTSWRGARVEPAPRAWAGWVRGTGPSLCDAGRSAVPAPPRRGPPSPAQSRGLGTGVRELREDGRGYSPCSAPNGQLGQRPGNHGRGWDSKPEEQAWALPNLVGRTQPGTGVWPPGKRPVVPPPLPPRAGLGAPSAGSDFVWGLFLSGPQEFSTVKQPSS